ncbi:hypothetical protein LTR08_001971 [Meristemomyces frigidus]|nr:hypothetical protein LTR08_001971 [Meristemomyces frigidus]
MLSLVQLFTLYLAIGNGPLARAFPLDERSPCALDASTRLALRDADFASKWSKRCPEAAIVAREAGIALEAADDEIDLAKRATASAYGSSTSSSKSSTPRAFVFQIEFLIDKVIKQFDREHIKLEPNGTCLLNANYVFDIVVEIVID